MIYAVRMFVLTWGASLGCSYSFPSIRLTGIIFSNISSVFDFRLDFSVLLQWVGEEDHLAFAIDIKSNSN